MPSLSHFRASGAARAGASVRVLTVSLLLVAGTGACGSSSSGPAASGDPAEAFTNNLEFGQGVSVTPLDGAQPEGSDTSGVTVEPLPGAAGPLTLSPGESFDFRVPWSGGNIAAVLIGFGGSKYFRVDVPQGSTSTSGIVNVPAKVGSGVCADLGNVCHQIQCYEQVVLPDGTTVTKAAAQQLVLNCTGGKDCQGNSVPSCATAADPCGVSCRSIDIAAPSGPACTFTGSIPLGQFVPASILTGGSAPAPGAPKITISLDTTTCKIDVVDSSPTCGVHNVIDLGANTCTWTESFDTGQCSLCQTTCTLK